MKKKMKPYTNGAPTMMSGTSRPHKSVDIKKADNGFIVSCYLPEGGEKIYIAKTPEEAQKYAAKMLGGKY